MTKTLSPQGRPISRYVTLFPSRSASGVVEETDQRMCLIQRGSLPTPPEELRLDVNEVIRLSRIDIPDGSNLKSPKSGIDSE